MIIKLLRAILEWEVRYPPPFSSNIAPSCLCRSMKKELSGHQFTCDKHLKLDTNQGDYNITPSKTGTTAIPTCLLFMQFSIAKKFTNSSNKTLNKIHHSKSLVLII